MAKVKLTEAGAADSVHLPAPAAAGQVIWVPLCGAAGKLTSPQLDQVTCSECLRVHQQAPSALVGSRKERTTPVPKWEDTPLPDRLRLYARCEDHGASGTDMLEAADELERLREENDRLKQKPRRK